MRVSIMKKPKNKFILVVISIIVFIIFSQVFIAFSNSSTDTNTYFTLVKGKWTLNEDFLELDQYYVVVPGDKIRVIWDSSLGVVEWWDGSLTRLGGNTKISIDQNQVSRDYSTINISFQLIAGKTWSHIVSFIGKDSSFTQNFEWIEAWVRGTIFDVDLDKDYIHISDHQVELTLESGEEITVWEGRALNLSKFSLIELEEFLKDIQDTAWVDLNKKFDQEYLNTLKRSLQKSLQDSNPLGYVLPYFSQKHQLLEALATRDDYSEAQIIIDEIPSGKRAEIRTAVLSKYQNINFVSAGDYEFYKRKVFYKKALIALGEEQDTEILVRSSVYDLQDMIQLGDIGAARETMSFLSDHKDILPNIDSSFLWSEFEKLPNKLKGEFQDAISDFEGILDFQIPETPNINVWGLEQQAREGIQSIDKKIQDFVGDKAGNLLDQFAR